MHAPSSPAPGTARRRHLRSAHRPPVTHTSAAERDPGVRAARAVTALVALATVLLFVLWTLAVLGHADATWWPTAVIVAMSLVAGLAAWILTRVT
jgi:hypothetical protein